MNLGNFLKREREKKGLSQRGLSLISGVSNSEISRIESGERKTPSPKVLLRLSSALEIPYEVFLEAAGYFRKDSDKSVVQEKMAEPEEYALPKDLVSFAKEESKRNWAFTRLAKGLSKRNLTPAEVLALVETFSSAKDRYSQVGKARGKKDK